MINALERYLGSDPGGERLRSAANGALAFLAALGVAALLASLTHAFEVDGSLPGAALTNHFARLAVLMLGSTTALVLSFTASGATVRARAVNSSIAAVGLWTGFALAVVVHGSRPIAYVLLVAVPAVGAWFRRYGARGFAAGFPMHVGYLVGFLLGAQVGSSRLGWTAAVIALAAVVTFVVGLAFLPDYERATARMQRSYRARARRVLALTAALMDPAADPRAAHRRARRLRRQVVRLNETALVLDVQLAQAPQGDDADGATTMRRRSLFEHERAVTMLARLAQQQAHDRVSPKTRSYARAVVTAARDLDGAALRTLAREPDRHDAARRIPPDGPGARRSGDAEVIAERYREAARALASAVDHFDLVAHPQHDRYADVGPVHGSVPLVGGWLPGAAIVNAAASSRQITARTTHTAMTIPTRVAIQLAVAVALAVTLGHLVSAAHLLWAVVAVYVTFLGSTSDREQLRKAAFRVAGTIIGVIVGDGLAHLTGAHTLPAVIVITAAAFFMMYFGRVNYALVVLAATIGATQFYAQAGELSAALLTTRVEETALGAACAIFVGLAAFPLRTAHAAELAVAAYLRALAQVLDGLTTADGPGQEHGPTTATRMLDSAFHTARATLRPLTRTLVGTIDHRCTQVFQLVDLSHELARTAVQDSAAVAGRPDGSPTELAGITDRAASTARAVADDLQHRPSRRVARTLPRPAEQRDDDPTPAAISLRTELEDLEAALTELAHIRGVQGPAPRPARMIA